MKVKIQLLLHYFWDNPGLGFRIKTKKKTYGKVFKIPYWLSVVIMKIGDKLNQKGGK